MRRIAPPAGLAVALALALTGGACGGQEEERLRVPAVAAEDAVVLGAQEASGDARGGTPATGAQRTREQRERRERAARRRLERSPTPEAALRRALLAGHLDRRAHDDLRAELARARATLGRLSGTPRTELAAVVGVVDALAAERRLTPSRLPAVFLTLRRNVEVWGRPGAAPAHRTTFPGDPVVFQHYPGRGLQVQHLASWGVVNGLAGHCLRIAQRGGDCPRERLRRGLDRLAGLASRRGDFLAWEHLFAFGGGRAPWISGMTQGTAVQALARGARVLGEPAYLRLARRALGAFEAPPPVGVAAQAPGGRHFLMYSFDPGLRILNGDLQAVSGLRDLVVLGGGRRARRVYRLGERAARRAVAAYDTGAWSLYSAGGAEATLHYHRLVGTFLGNLCASTERDAYCAARERFARYEREPPRIGVGDLVRLRARRPVAVRVSVSKRATVRVRVWGTRGTSLDVQLAMGRGGHELRWVPPARGRYRLRVEARGVSGPVGVEERALRVALPRPRDRDRDRDREREPERRERAAPEPQDERRPEPAAPAPAPSAPAPAPAPEPPAPAVPPPPPEAPAPAVP